MKVNLLLITLVGLVILFAHSTTGIAQDNESEGTLNDSLETILPLLKQFVGEVDESSLTLKSAIVSAEYLTGLESCLISGWDSLEIPIIKVSLQNIQIHDTVECSDTSGCLNIILWFNRNNNMLMRAYAPMLIQGANNDTMGPA